MGVSMGNRSNGKKSDGMRGARIAVSVLGAAAIIAMAIATPVAIDPDSGNFILKVAVAGNGNGGGNGGGHGGGNNGHGKGKGNASAPPENDRKLIILPVEAAVTMAHFTTKISKRYPADDISTYDNPHLSISFFSEFQGMSGDEITHRWVHGGNVKFQALFKIRADRWRAWSTQMLPKDMPGLWSVEVVDKEGKVLAVHQLNYVPVGTAIAAK